MPETETWDLDKIKRSIAELPPEERDRIHRRYPHLTTPELDDVPLPAVDPDELHDIMK